MQKNIVIEREYFPYLFKIKGSNLIVGFTPSLTIFGEKINDKILPLTVKKQKIVKDMGLEYKYKQNFDEEKEDFQYPDQNLILKQSDGSSEWVWIEPGYDGGKFVNKKTGIACGCTGCSGTNYLEIEDKIRVRKLIRTKNYCNIHCLYCSCINCVCIGRVNSGHFTKYTLLPGESNICSKLCPICIAN